MNSSFRLALRYKVAKLWQLLPSKKKRQLSKFEDLGFRSEFYFSLWQDAAEALGLNLKHLGYGYWQISDSQGRCVRGNTEAIDLDSHVSVVLSGNKPLTHQLLAHLPDYRSPRYMAYTLRSIADAYSFMKHSQASCVVKPASGTGAGCGVFTDVSNLKALESASVEASTWNKNLLIEETVPGHSYRLLVLGNKMIHAVRRDPPVVIGDGHSRIYQLIEKENVRRMTSKPLVSLHPIQIDLECKQALSKQSLGLNSVPDKGVEVRVKEVVNQNSAQQNIDVTGSVHPDIAALAVAASFQMGLTFCGVDVITKDIGVPLSESGGVVNELNASPGLHHHYLIADDVRPKIAEQLIAHSLAKRTE